MPEWVIVGESPDGTPHVLVEWLLCFDAAPVADVRAGLREPAVFGDRWAAKRVLRGRNEWREWRAIRRNRL